MSIAKYRCAKHNLKHIATGGSDVLITNMVDNSNVGIYVDHHPRYSNNSSWYSNEITRGIGQTVMARVLEKLEPAIQSLFRRYLEEYVEELRLAAVAEAQANWQREGDRLAGIVAEMEAPFDEPDSEA